MSVRDIRQGDSDWYDVPRTDGTILDAGDTGQWAIISAIGATPIVSGAMTKSADNYYFMRRITPANTLACPVGKYILVTQISNSSLLYSSEISHEQIRIIAQGIVAA